MERRFFLKVSEDMTLSIWQQIKNGGGEPEISELTYRQTVAVEGDENSVIIAVEQPQRLEYLNSRAEIEMSGEKMSVHVIGGRFVLPKAIAGGVRFQLVYSDGTGEFITKSTVASSFIGGSINAPSRGGQDYKNGEIIVTGDSPYNF